MYLIHPCIVYYVHIMCAYVLVASVLCCICFSVDTVVDSN